MAAQSANVTSVDALRHFRAALVKFAAEVESALIALDLEARRPVEWIESNRARYWPLQVRKASDEVSEARLALDRCQFKISSEDEKSCYDERKALEKAKRRLQLAEEKTDAVKRWRYQMHKATEDFQTQTARTKQYLETELVKAVAALDRMTEALDRYAEQAGAATPKD
jgi:hypothetical protein